MEGLEALHHKAARVAESHHALELGLQLAQLLAMRRKLRTAGFLPAPIGIFRCRAKGIFKHPDLPVPRALEAVVLPDMPGTRIFREGCPKSWRLYGRMIDN